MKNFFLQSLPKSSGKLTNVCLFIMLFCFVTGSANAQTTVTYTQQTDRYYTTYDGGSSNGMYNSNSYQIGMYANGGSKQMVAWRKFRTDASGAPTSDRNLQVGDQFVVTLNATRAYGRMGFALLASPAGTGSYADRENNYAISFNLDGPAYGGWGNWYAKYNSGATSSGSANIAGVAGSYKGFTFTLTLTAPDRMNATWTDGTTTSNLYDILLNTSNPITDYSIYLEDDYDGAGNSNAYWGLGAVGTQHKLTNNGVLDVGQSNASFTESGIITNGLNANSASTNSLNNALTKSGTGVVTLTGSNTYVGTTTITGGELRLNPAANTTTSSPVVLNGGTLSTTSIASGRTITSSSTMNLAANSGIQLGANTHTLTFANSSGVTWAGSTLAINGWAGTAGASGTGGKIFFGNTTGTLTSTQLSKIDFTGYVGAILLNTGEVVPASSSAANITSISASPNDGTSTHGYAGSTVTVTGAGFTGASTVKYGGSGGTSVGSFTVVNDNTITFTAVAGTTGAIYVSGPAGNATSGTSFTNAGYITQAAGTYSTGSTWLGGMAPGTGAAVTIDHNPVTITTIVVQGNVTINTGAKLSCPGYTISGSTLTNSGIYEQTGTLAAATFANVINDGTITFGSANTFTISSGGTFTNNTGGSVTGTTGTVIFAGSGMLNGSAALTFYNLTINGSVAATTAPAINNILLMNAGASLSGGAPTYGSSSLLKYNTSGNPTLRGSEWSSSSGAGYPVDVQISNNTTLDPGGTSKTGTALNTSGNFTIDAGSAMYMDYGGHSMTVPLTVNGNILISGNISGSQNSGGYIIAKGNWTYSGGGANFYPNSRKVAFSGSANQNIGGANNTTPSFYQLEINNAAGVTFTSSESIGNNLTLTNGLLTLGPNSLTLLAGATTTGGAATSYVKTNSTGRLIQTVASANTFYAVGKSAYNPITLNNSGTSDTYGVYVLDAITTPAPNNSSKLVNRYWNVNEGTAGGSNLAITVQWNSPAEENANFAAGIVPKVGLYSGSWLEQGATAAAGTVAGSQAHATNANFTPSNIAGGATVGAGVDNGFAQALPTITNFTPSSGNISSPIVITGTNLGSVTSVTFGGVPAASFTVNSTTQITAIVGSGATGSITVTNPSGTASMAGFVYNGYITVQNGSYNAASTWITNTVPPAGAVVTIAHTVTLGTLANTASSLTINSGASLDFNNVSSALTATTVTNNGTLSWSAAGTLVITTGGSLTNSGTFTRGTGIVVFSGTGTSAVSGTITFNNVTLQKGVNFGTASTVSGTLEMKAGAYIFTNAPVYANGSTLLYNTGGSYGRYTEWSATSGKGYPYNVIVQGGTTLNVQDGGSTAASCAGNLSIVVGSQLTMGSTGAALTVNGNVLNSGTLTLSSSAGGDMNLYGNLTDNGTFNANNRAVFFSGGAIQNISGSNTFDIAYVRINKTGGSVKMLTNLLCEGPAGGSAMEISGTTSILDLNGHQLTLGKAGVASTYNTSVATAGSIKGGNTSSIIVLGTGALGTIKFDQTTDSSTNVLANLTINRTSAGSVTLGNKLVITNVLTPSNGTLVTGGFLHIRSTAANTAQVAAGSASGGYVSGNVTVERFIPAYGHRAWRMLAIPTGGSQTIKAAWQEGQTGQTNTMPGYGTILTNTTGTNGYDASTTGNSLLMFNTGNPGGWSGVSSTNNAIATTAGYMLYMRGDRNSSPFGGPVAQSKTTLRTTGTLYQGDQGAVTLQAGNNVLVGNLYASAVDFAAMTRSGISSFKVWDSKLAGTSGLGAFQTFSSSNGYSPIPGGGSYGNNPNTRIESGQAFILNSTSGGSITLTEASKVGGSKNIVFRSPAAIQQLKANLYAVIDGANSLADGNAVVFADNFSNAVDNDDAVKVNNINENIGIQNSHAILAVEARENINAQDEIHYNISNLKRQQYMLELVPANINETGLNAYLQDTYLGSKTPVSLSKITEIYFDVTADAASFAAGRFSIVFQSKATAPVNIVVSSKVFDKNVQLNWKVDNEKNEKLYEIEKSENGTVFKMVGTVANRSAGAYLFSDESPLPGANYYRIKAVDFSAGFVYSATTKVIVSNGVGHFAIKPNPVEGGRLNISFVNQPVGAYTLRVINTSGQVLFTNNITHTGENTVKRIALPLVPAGSYNLEITNTGGLESVQKIFVAAR